MYGSETEIFVHTFQKNGKTQNLAAEKGGRNTVDNPLRFKLPQNLWNIVVSESAPRVPLSHVQPVVGSSSRQTQERVADILDTLSRNLRTKGTYGFANLKNAFRDMDLNQNGFIEPQEFRSGFRRCGIALSDEDFEVILAGFDHDKNGKIDYQEFVKSINVGPS